ncbi:hypothetical protein LFM09_37545 [Lentzea alba]|uniref:hypothetical protein n=1 Tax=Lentzea alba TaxID=2714351 RepID=UPI0039BEF862
MADITLRVEASGENLAQVTAELLALLTTEARVDARPVTTPAPDGAKSGTGISLGVIALNLLTRVAERRASAAVATWLEERETRKVTVVSADGQDVFQGNLTRAERVKLEKWLSDRG